MPEGIPFVLGQALYLTAIHGGKANNDTIDSPTSAAWLRGGMLPQASVSLAAMRATRALRRRRPHLLRKRAALLAQGQTPHSQSNLPEIGQQSAYKANRQGVAERVDEAAVQKTMAVALALLPSEDELLTALALSILTPAKPHDAHTLSLLQPVPGIGKLLSRGLLDDIHDLRRLPSGPDCASSTRLGKCRQEAGGKRLGPAGQKIGPAHRTWAFAEAATLCLRNNEPGQKLLARLEKKHDKGKALRILAPTWGRAIYDMLKRQGAFDRERFLQTYGSRAGEPGASLDPSGDEPA